MQLRSEISATETFQRVFNAAAWLVVGLGPFDHVTPASRQLHWLSIKQCIQYRLCLLTHVVHINKAPHYLTELVTSVAQPSTRCGRQSNDTATYVISSTRTKSGERGFHFAAPNAWNNLSLYNCYWRL